MNYQWTPLGVYSVYADENGLILGSVFPFDVGRSMLEVLGPDAAPPAPHVPAILFRATVGNVLESYGENLVSFLYEQRAREYVEKQVKASPAATVAQTWISDDVQKHLLACLASAQAKFEGDERRERRYEAQSERREAENAARKERVKIRAQNKKAKAANTQQP